MCPTVPTRAAGSICAYVCTMPVESADFWHYLKAGQHMLDSRSVLDRDLYTFTIQGRPFVNLHWGSQVLYAIVVSAGGVKLLVFVHALAMTGALAVLFLAATVYLLERRRPEPLPWLFAAWANLHAAFPVGLVLVGIYAATPDPGDDAANAPGPASRPAWTTRPRRLALAATCAAATLLTPWGLRLYPAVLAAETASRAARIGEWDAATVLSPQGRVFFIAFGLLLAAGGSGRPWC